MPSTIPDFWPNDISPLVLTPLAIMRAQVPGLERRTQGLLEAEVGSVEREKDVVHNFDLIAPALDSFRERILVVTHDRTRVYPAALEAACFTPVLKKWAMSQAQFLDLIKEVIQSTAVRSSIESLIARSNEVTIRQTTEQPAGKEDLTSE